MNEMKIYGSYREYKRELDTELQKSAEGFVKIGFLLKQARDTDILEESGYKSYIDFAQAEYGIDKTTVSRFIRINDKFAEEGNSEYLQKQYKGYGYAKLAIMLQLPDEVNNILTPEFSKSEIQSIKEEVDEESKITDLEVMMESEPNMTKYCDTSLYKAIIKLCHDEPKIYLLLHKALEDNLNQEDRLKAISETIAPTETKVCMVRIPGIGRLAVSFKGLDQNIEVVNIRSGEKEEYSWKEMLQTILPLMLDDDAKDSWSKLFLESFPEPEVTKTEEVAPVQRSSEHKPEPKKTETKKVSKVTKAKERIKEIFEDKAEEKEPEEQLPGQMDIEEYIGDSNEEDEDENQEVVLSDNALEDTAEVSEDGELVTDFYSGNSTDIVDSSCNGLRQKAEALNEDIYSILQDWESDEDITVESLEKAKGNADKLAAVLEQLLWFVKR